MDKYLEGLVRKGETEGAQAEEPVTEEVVEVAEEAAPAEEAAEPVVEEAPAPEPAKKADVKIKAEKPAPAPKPVANADETVTVTNIKIFNTPDVKGAFKMFSGNVIVKGNVGDLKMIEYVKPGFGLVVGYTSDLK